MFSVCICWDVVPRCKRKNRTRVLSSVGVKVVIDNDLLQMLVCPLSKAPVELVGEELICEKSQLAYPIIDGIPILLVEEARKIEPLK